MGVLCLENLREIWDNFPLLTFHENFVPVPEIITPLAKNLAPHPGENSYAALAVESSECEHPLENLGIDSLATDGEATTDEFEPMQTE